MTSAWTRTSEVEPGGEQLAVAVAGALGDPEAGVAEEAVEADEGADPDHPELLADHRGDHVGVGLGQVEGLLQALAEPDAEQPAGAERDLRLDQLEAGAARVAAGVEEATVIRATR